MAASEQDQANPEHPDAPAEKTPTAQAASDTDRPSPDVLPVVAIGASAGGLAALQAFFRNVPPDCGIAFVVITHTNPDRTSLLPELLADVTRMTVVAAEDGMEVAANKVIVVRDGITTLREGKLYREPTDPQEARYHPVDHLFRSLATDQCEHAICVVLSGSGNDGALGVKAVKAAGGMAMVQDPDSAGYASMPESACATDLVDYVLPAEDLPEALLQYCSGPYLTLALSGEGPPFPDNVIHAILVRLRSHTGQDFTCYKKSTMARRIERRMNVHHIEEPQAYLKFLRENLKEMDALQKELLISVTSFFRDSEAFQSLRDEALPLLLDRLDDSHTLRVWVAGCATGEEAYSVAIVLDEALRKADRRHDVQIFASDLDEAAIEKARAGLYPAGIASDVSPERLKRYFNQEDGAYRVQKRLRDMLVFAQHNIISDPPFMRMDLIVCRNVLIYLNADAQQRVLPLFHYALAEGGVLFLGSSENITGSEELFKMIDKQQKIMRRKETSRPVHPALTMTHIAPRRGMAALEGAPSRGGQQNIIRTVQRRLLDQFAPCSLVVDEKDTVVYIHGNSGRYFQPEQGEPKNDILQMAREGLRIPLTRALRRARRDETTVEERDVRVRTNGDTTRTDLTAQPFDAPEALHGLLLVTLQPSEAGQEHAEAADTKRQAPPEPARSEPEANAAELERELKYTRENLQTTIEELETSNEELKSSNEELQSTNEELQSSNEEMETGREEMQSLNEELNTVNAELKSKVEALARANDDMNNLLNSMQVATIFLDQDLRVKRYTSQAQDIVRLIESDIGRPLNDLTSTLNYDNLTEDCQRVLATLATREREIRDKDGRWFQVRLMPYRTAQNVIDGVVVTMVDITRTKRAERAAEDARTFFQNIVETVRHPIVVLDTDLRVVQTNDAFCSMFNTAPKETEGTLIYDLGNRQWDIPELRTLLEDVLPSESVMTDFRVEHDFPRIGRRTFLLNARRLNSQREEAPMVLLAFEHVTE